jgi:hypothetical protein
MEYMPAHTLRKQSKDRAKRAALAATPEGCEQLRFAQQLRREKHPWRYIGWSNWYKAKNSNLLCDCCTQEDIEKVYKRAWRRGGGYDVDHIVPLGLGGLHCAKNLQVLSEFDHALKTRKDRRAMREHFRDFDLTSKAVIYLFSLGVLAEMGVFL